MKLIILVIFIFSGSFAYAKTYEDMFNLVYRNKLYYSSYIFLKKSIERNKSVSQIKANRLLEVIHPSVYIHDPDLDKLPMKKHQLDFAVGVRTFFKNNFKVAEYKLRRVTKRNPMYMESNYLLGLINLRKNNLKEANKHFSRCVQWTKRKHRTEEKPESYVRTLRNRCIQQVGRINYTAKNYKKALRVYNYVSSDDFLWPRFLIDKAWTYYWMGQPERALGSVMTYKAPMLRRFMIPEANYLRGLIYFEMCYFEKAENIYKEFNRNTWRFRKVAQSASKNRLLKLILAKKTPKSEADQFLYYYLKGFKQDIRYISFLYSKKQISAEIKQLSRIKSLSQAKVFLDQLYYYDKAILEDFRDFLKNLTNDYYNQISNMRNAFVKLNLMVSLKKRKQIKTKNSDKFNDEFSEKSLAHIPNIQEKFIWNFEGGFWADELGDYAIALENQCQQK